jgi:ELWxxDGT repeat protein
MAETLEDRLLLSSTPAMVSDINPGPASSIFYNGVQPLVSIGSTAYFSADDGIHGVELWKSDGTAAGTMMVKDISPGAGSPSAYELTNVNGTLFFRANDGVNGTELWKSDGTAAGTTMVKDIFPGGYTGYYGGYYLGSSNPSSLTNVNGTLFFSAWDGINGTELWKSDGTAAGTVMVKDLLPGIYGSDPRYLTNVNGTLFFMAHGGDGIEHELWKSDGTEAGTVEVSSFGGNGLTNVNGTLYFTGNDGVNGWELWKSDGTAAGTTMVKDLFPGTTIYTDNYGLFHTRVNSSDPAVLTDVNGTLFFSANDGVNGQELWKSDGTDAGTVMVKDILPGAGTSDAYDLTNVNGTLFFTANDGVNGQELWKSDGTTAGTTLVKDIFPGVSSIEGPYSSDPAVLTNVNGMLYFNANDGVHGYELWKSNGTSAGTVLVKDIFPGSNSSFRWKLVNANGTLFLPASDGVHGTELWALNTAPAPSLSVSGFPTTTTAGSAGSFAVTAKNADDTTNTAYVGTVHFTSTDPLAVLPADYTFTAADHGVHTFTAKLKTAGYQGITVADPQAPGMDGTQTNILVKPAAASTMTVGGFPSTTTAGVAGNVTVTLKDPYGNIASGYTGTVRWTSSDAKAVLPANYTFTAVDAGQHTFSVTLKTAGTQAITVADTLNSVFTATQGGITVNAGAASQFLISAPSSVKTGVPFSLTLTVKDAYGNVVIGYVGTVRFTSTDTTAKLPANYTFKSTDQGVHTFTGLILRKRGNQKITITDTLNSSLSATGLLNVSGGTTQGSQ